MTFRTDGRGLLLATLALLFGSAANAAPMRVPYSGEMTLGSAPFTGTVNLEAALYASPMPNLGVDFPVWPQSTGAAPWNYGAVDVDDGIFTILLGDSGDPLDSDLVSGFPGGLWLVLWVDGEPALPAQSVLSVPYALMAADADRLGGLDASDYVTFGDVHPVALTGDYGALSNAPPLHPVALSGNYTHLTNKPILAVVASSGSYNDLLNKPSLHPVATSGSYTQLNNKPSLATVATSGSYTDLLNKPALHPVAASGSYDDLSNTPNLSSFATASGSGGYLAKFTTGTNLNSSGLYQSGSALTLGTTTQSGGIHVTDEPILGKNGRTGVSATIDIDATTCCSNGGSGSTTAAGKVSGSLASIGLYDLNKAMSGVHGEAALKSIGFGTGPYAAGGRFVLRNYDGVSEASVSSGEVGAMIARLEGAYSGQGTYPVAAVLGIDAATAGTHYAGFFQGNVVVNGTASKPGGGSWATYSDARLKDVGPRYGVGLAEIEQLETVSYRYKADNALELPSDRTYYGFVAQQVQSVIPEAVEVRSDGYLTVDNDPILLGMLNAIRELAQDKRTLEATVNAQQAQIDDLEGKLGAMQQQLDAITAALGR
jgi:hypothetical protein